MNQKQLEAFSTSVLSLEVITNGTSGLLLYANNSLRIRTHPHPHPHPHAHNHPTLTTHISTKSHNCRDPPANRTYNSHCTWFSWCVVDSTAELVYQKNNRTMTSKDKQRRCLQGFQTTRIELHGRHVHMSYRNTGLELRASIASAD